MLCGMVLLLYSTGRSVDRVLEGDQFIYLLAEFNSSFGTIKRQQIRNQQPTQPTQCPIQNVHQLIC
jgi:hypothetical protein